MMDDTVSRAENVLAQWEHDQHLGGSSIEGAPTGEEWADVVRGLLNRQAVLEAKLREAGAWARWFAAERDDWAHVNDVVLTHTLRYLRSIERRHQ